MSLRRSARVASSSTGVATPEIKPSSSGAKYEKAPRATTTAPASKKRKAGKAAAASPPSEATEEEANGQIIPAPDLPFAVPELPSTPLPKKRRTAADDESPIKPPPFTPTPSGVGLIVSSVGKAASKGGSENDHPLEDLCTLTPQQRPADPHATNAPVATADGDAVVTFDAPPSGSQTTPSASQGSPAKKRKAKEVPPDVGAVPVGVTDVENLLKNAEEYLVKVDPKLKSLVEKHHCKIFSPEGLREVVDPFTALSSGIIGQQVSGQAAASIRKKFTALFPDTHPAFPSPAQVLAKDLPTLRTAGLSQRKAEYISGLAEKFNSGELSAEMLVSASDADLIEKLVAVRGLGRWSVEMFACFGLKRMDVFSTGDLGVQRGMATYMGRDTNKLKAKGGKWKYMSEKEMLDIASRFSPYRSLFMWYMWRIENVDISVMQ